jgi:hypothetical protein
MGLHSSPLSPPTRYVRMRVFRAFYPHDGADTRAVKSAEGALIDNGSHGG